MKTGVTTDRSPSLLPVMGLGRSLIFRSRVDSSAGPDACWPVGAHRVAWSIANDREVPTGLVVRHTCDNPPCCNPDHLDIGTPGDNVRDAQRRGRLRNQHGKGATQ